MVPLRDARAVLLAQPHDTTEIRAAIARALQARRFTAEGEEPGAVVAQFSRGATQLRVRIAYTPTQFQIVYVDSEGFGHGTNESGQTVISNRYERYVRDLTASINDELGRPAREAQRAQQEERDHQLALMEAQRRQQEQAAAAEAAERDRARQADADERERDRQAALERDRLRLATARANADRHRPIIVTTAPAQQPVVVAQPVAPRYVVVSQSGGYAPAQPAAPPPPPPPATCQDVLLERGHPATSLMFCNNAERRCAVALLRAGHDPTNLIHCQSVQPRCAEAMMQRGDHPTQLIHCR